MSEQISRLLEVMARLRHPETGCPWDIEQSFATIAPYTIEEAYEVAEAIADGDMSGLKEELGDLLLQVVYHARMAEEERLFDFEAVAQTIADKMIRRHPHVFGTETVDSAEAQTASWEAQKAAERARKAVADGTEPSALDGVPLVLPALTRAEKLGKRASRVGFDWPETAPVIEKIEEEIAEVRAALAADAPPEKLEEELGDLLFSVVNLARHLRVEPEHALRAANRKFERRFRQVEKTIADSGRRLDETGLDEMEDAWAAAKAAEE
jgi:MazG family protein